jgi:serine/threonine protein kinase KIN1/2
MLDYIITHGRLSDEETRVYSRQIASALDYCHKNHIVHRDVKIENMLITRTRDIKLIDFALSSPFSQKSSLDTFCGSLYFSAPELLQGQPYIGPEIDIYSFGIVIYTMICGKVPFDDDNLAKLYEKTKTGAVEFPNFLSESQSNCNTSSEKLLTLYYRLSSASRSHAREKACTTCYVKRSHEPPLDGQGILRSA